MPSAFSHSMRRQLYEVLTAQRGLQQWSALAIAEANYPVGDTELPSARVSSRAARKLTNRCLDGKISLDELWQGVWGISRRQFTDEFVRSQAGRSLSELPAEDAVWSELRRQSLLPNWKAIERNDEAAAHTGATPGALPDAWAPPRPDAKSTTLVEEPQRLDLHSSDHTDPVLFDPFGGQLPKIRLGDDGLSTLERSRLLLLCERDLAPAAYEFFLNGVRDLVGPEGGMQRVEAVRIAELHLNSIRRAARAHLGDDYERIPLVDNAAFPADWLLRLFDAQARVIQLEREAFAGSMLEALATIYHGSKQQGAINEVALAERTFAVYEFVSSGAPLPPSYEARSFDPAWLELNRPVSFATLVDDALSRHCWQSGPFRKPLDVRFNREFSIIDWYVAVFSRPANATTIDQLEVLIGQMNDDPLLDLSDSHSDAELISAYQRIESKWLSDRRSGVSQDDVVFCWLEVKRRLMCDVLSEMRASIGTEPEQVVERRDGRGASQGLDSVLEYVSWRAS